MILVTGGTGLVGAHLLLQLCKTEVPLRAIYRTTSSIDRTKDLFKLNNLEELFFKIEWVEADILDLPALELAFENITIVYHCAALISFDPSDEYALRKTNIEGTANITNLCIDFKIKKLCFISSIAALGDLAANEKYVTEETDWNPEKPHSDYAISKYGAEIEVWRAFQEGVPVIILNPGIILGGVDTASIFTGGSSDLYQKIKNGFPFYTAGKTGIVVVEDVCSIAIALTNSTIKNERYIVVSQNISIQHLFSAIAKKLNTSSPKYRITPLAMKTLWIIDWLFATLFFQKRRLSKAIVKSSFSEQLYDNTKIKAALGTTFTTIDDYLAN